MRKRLFSVVLAGLLLLVQIPPVGVSAAVTPEYLVNETYGSAVFSDPMPGWSYSRGFVTLVDGDANSNSKVLNFKGTDAWGISFIRSFSPQTGEIHIKARVKVTDYSIFRFMRIIGSGAVETADYNGLGSVRMDTSGGVILSGKTNTGQLPGAPLKLGQWQEINIMINTVKKTLSAWIGETRPSSVPTVAMRMETQGLGGISIDTNNGTSSIQLDKLQVSNISEFSLSELKYFINDKEYTTYDSLVAAGSGRVTANVKNRSDSGKACTLVSAIYDERGALYKAEKTLVNMAANAVENVSVNYSIPQNANGYRLRLFTFSDLGTAQPILPNFERKVQSYKPFQTANVFSNTMVLQRNQQIPVFGQANVGRQVTVEFAGQVKSAVADDKNRWCVYFDPMPATYTGRAMTITAAADMFDTEKVKTINDVVIGDVWLASGQSNMQLALSTCKPDIVVEPTNKIRLISIKTLDERDVRNKRDSVDEKWETMTNNNARGMSAIAFYFAQGIQPEIDVPVGIINCYRGATNIETWMDMATLPTGDPVFETMRTQYEASLLPTATYTANDPGSMYENMMDTVQPYAIKGMMWYQGESNSNKPSQYIVQLPAMVADWRAKFDANFPFFVFQLPKYNSDWSVFREAQYLATKQIPNAELLVTIDTGDPTNPDTGVALHPKDKDKVAEKILKAARVLVYGGSGEYTGPRYESHRVVGAAIELSFTHVGSGLVSLAADHSLPEFQICGSDGKYYAATATISGDKVMVSSPSVAAPVAVRYAFSKAPALSLGNVEGEPAMPFRTDKTK